MRRLADDGPFRNYGILVFIGQLSHKNNSFILIRINIIFIRNLLVFTFAHFFSETDDEELSNDGDIAETQKSMEATKSGGKVISEPQQFQVYRNIRFVVS